MSPTETTDAAKTETTNKDIKREISVEIPAAEVARRSDMHCTVTGPVLRELCYTLFTHPRMQEAFATWSTRKE